MKQLNIYIIEKLYINKETKTYDWKEDESIDHEVLNHCLKDIEEYNNENNIKTLISKYADKKTMDSYSKNHWKVCVYVIKEMIKNIKYCIEQFMKEDPINIPALSEYLSQGLEKVKHTANADDCDEDGPESLDWDEDAMFSLFNTISCELFSKKLLLEN